MSSSQTTSPHSPNPSSGDTIFKAQSALESLSPLLGDSIPPSLSSSENLPFSLLHSLELSRKINACLRQPLSGAGDDNICRWLYDTFQSSDPHLQLIVLRFLPTLAGVYLIRAVARKPLPGFEAVLLALYAHVTKTRSGQPVTVTIPDLSHPSLYHETFSKAPSKNNATEINLAILSPTLEPHGTVRSTRRARIVGVTLELYYSKIAQMPVSSKLDFCAFCEVWAGQDGDMFKGSVGPSKSNNEQDGSVDDDGPDSNSNGGDDVSAKSVKEECGEKGGRIPLPWELLQPCLRILGHCLLGPTRSRELKKAAWDAVRSLYARALHDVDPQAILATSSLLKLGKIEIESMDQQLDQSISTDGTSHGNLVVFAA